MIKTLIVEDSPVIRELLVFILSSDPAIHVIGTACDGEEALEMVREKKPDVITMDIHMPKLDGITATRKIMETYPTSIVIVSSSIVTDEVSLTFRAIEAGALAVIHRPAGVGHPDFQMTALELINTIKLMSEVKVVRRWPHYRKYTIENELELKKSTPLPPAHINDGAVQIIALGASTGGPTVLQTIFSNLGKDFPVPLLAVQHIASGFLQGFVEWLAQTSDLPIHVAAHHELIVPGNIYLAPDGLHMGVDSAKRIVLSKDEPEGNLRPAVSYLLRSVAEVYGHNAVGVLLTGMGKDGAKELCCLKEKGAITIAQDAESSVVHGMPGEAIQLNGALYVLPPEKIAMLLKKLANNRMSDVLGLQMNSTL